MKSHHPSLSEYTGRGTSNYQGNSVSLQAHFFLVQQIVRSRTMEILQESGAGFARSVRTQKRAHFSSLKYEVEPKVIIFLNFSMEIFS